MARLREWSGWSGWFVAAAGAVLCVLGWYGVSGESVAEQQLPYLASATIPGAALIVAGAVLIASRPRHADQRIETLYSLLVADAAEPGTQAPAADLSSDPQTLLAVPGGTLYHRRDCPLVADKPSAEPIDARTATERGLAPCPVCGPPQVPAAGEPDRPAAGPAAEPPGPDRRATEPGHLAEPPSVADQPEDPPGPDRPTGP